ncbi:MAG TPA: polysaccharide deacetylase family protein [Vicinamibacteria bacterium]|nr:polysaccharide deacetylase family protein [Vicinamibacteria bacterium]
MPVLRRSADAGRLLLDLVTRDPAFVRGGELEPGDIPVFTFHSLEPRSFERKMAYLKDAGYQAIGLAEYLDVLSGRRGAPGKSVLITIDDGRASTWTVGYPILKKLGMRATAFLVTSAVHDSPDVSKTIGDEPEALWPALVARDESRDRPFVTWGEVRAMRDVIDLGSHTHLHARIPVATGIEGVMTEAMQRGYREFDCPFVWINGRQVRGRDVPPGTPLPVSAPRLSGRPAWRAVDGRFETEAEVRDAVRFDLGEARRLLMEKADVDATSLCFPWHVDSPLARELAAAVGYVAGFAGKAAAAPAISRPGCDPFAIARVGEDYVDRLPGPGRRSLLSVLRQKMRRG